MWTVIAAFIAIFIEAFWPDCIKCGSPARFYFAHDQDPSYFIHGCSNRDCWWFYNGGQHD